MRWYFFTAYRPNGSRVYSRGPVRLSESAALAELGETAEAFWDAATVRAFRWTGARWERWP